MKVIQKHNERFNKKKIRSVGLLSFLMGTSGASLIYVVSDYLNQSIGNENVGILYAVTYLVLFFLLLNFHKLVNKFGKTKLFFVLQFIKIVILLMLSFFPVSGLGTFFIVGYMMLSYVTWVEMDMILESFSIDKISGRIRGTYLTLHSLGYMIGPIVSTQLLQKFGYSSIFTFAMTLNCIFLVVAILNFRLVKTELREIIGARKLMKKIVSNKDLTNIYLVSVVLEIFFALMVVYMPIHLLDQGLHWVQIGLIFSLIHIPFIVLQYPAGVLADKKIGEKEMMAMALLLTGSSTVFIYFIDSAQIFVWLIILMVTRIGAALVEILRDSYFYKKVDARDVDLIGFFRTAGPVGFVIGPLIGYLLLLFFSVKAIFFFVGIAVFGGVFFALSLKDNLSEEERLIQNGTKTVSNGWKFWEFHEWKEKIRNFRKI